MMRPLARAATLLPPAALRADAGVALTAFARYAPALLTVTPVMLCRGQLLLYTDRSRKFAAALLVCLLLSAQGTLHFSTLPLTSITCHPALWLDARFVMDC